MAAGIIQQEWADDNGSEKAISCLTHSLVLAEIHNSCETTIGHMYTDES